MSGKHEMILLKKWLPVQLQCLAISETLQLEQEFSLKNTEGVIIKLSQTSPGFYVSAV